MLKAFQEFLKKILRVFQEYFEGCLKQAQKECVKLFIEVYGIFEGVSKNFRGVLGKPVFASNISKLLHKHFEGI